MHVNTDKLKIKRNLHMLQSVEYRISLQNINLDFYLTNLLTCGKSIPYVRRVDGAGKATTNDSSFIT
jgi:hypothetical protein